MSKQITPLFTRPYSITKRNLGYLQELQRVLNVDKLNTWTINKTYQHYNINFEQEYLGYRFEVLNQWIINNSDYNHKFVTNLKEIVYSLGLESYLTTQEKNYINNFNSVVFAKNRNIKNLVVDFELETNEEIWYTYEIFAVYSYAHEEWKQIIRNTQLYLSNQRVIIATSGNVHLSINYIDLVEMKLKNNCLEIKTYAKSYLIVAEDIKTLYVSFERVGKLIKRNI